MKLQNVFWNRMKIMDKQNKHISIFTIIGISIFTIMGISIFTIIGIYTVNWLIYVRPNLYGDSDEIKEFCKDSESEELMSAIQTDLESLMRGNSYDPHGFYNWVSIDIESPQHNGKAVINVEDLFCYLQLQEKYSSCDNSLYGKFLYIYYDYMQDLNQKKYAKKTYCMLKEKSTLKIEKESDLAEYSFHIVHYDSTVVANAQKGIEHFIKTYLKRGSYSENFLNDGITTENELYAILDQLYNFKIQVMPDIIEIEIPENELWDTYPKSLEAK